jgi:hypothetical protein
MRRHEPDVRRLHARQVNRDLQNAEGRLCNALQETTDDAVARSIEAARKALKPALRRAKLAVKDADLRAAEQLDLGPDAGVPTREEA